jgi:hypothetical protein
MEFKTEWAKKAYLEVYDNDDGFHAAGVRLWNVIVAQLVIKFPLLCNHKVHYHVTRALFMTPS